LTEKQREHLITINRSGEHLLALINDILDMSRIEAGQMTLNVAPFDLHQMLDDLERMFRVRTEAKGLQLLIEKDEMLPRYVVADEGKLRQILTNLLGNAVKFTDKGGIALRMKYDGGETLAEESITARRSAIRLLMEVQDTGVGIAEKDIGEIFQPFHQAAMGYREGGTGLGLAISRQLARMMGGDITVTSELGRGSCFRVEVEVGLAEAEEVEKQATERRVIGIKPGQKRYRLLIVDDKRDNRALLTELLASVGFETAEATDGAEAIARFEEWQPDCILMDMRMPGMDGYEATRRIKATERGAVTPIIAVTATSFDDARERVMATGADAYIRKPFRTHEIFEALHKCLGVELVYEERETAPMTTPAAAAPLSREAVAELTEEMVTAIREAVEQGDMSRLTALIKEVEASNPALAAGLRSLAAAYDYEKLLELFSGARG